jgi:hypothetical protein
MDLSTIWYTVSDQFQQLAPARRTLKPYMFNLYLQYVDMDLLRETLRMKYNPSEDVSGNPEQMDVLRYFKKSETVDSSTAHTLPSGYMRFISAYDGDVEVRSIDVDTYAKWKSNDILAPSTTNPILYIKGDDIITDPITIGTYTLWYYGANMGSDKPNLVLEAEDSINVYDSVNSEELVWPEWMYPRITQMILKYLGFSVNDQSLIQEKLKEYDNVTT